MKVHANAPLGPKGRWTMVRRVVEQEWSITQAAAAAGVSRVAPAGPAADERTVSVPALHDETARLVALRTHELLDTPPEPAFDDLARLAAQVCRAPIAAVALLDAH